MFFMKKIPFLHFKKKRIYQPNTMLVDYYRAVIATDGADSYIEMVLRTTEKEDCVVLDVYHKDSSDAPETCVTYFVPYEAVEACFQLIYKYRLPKWNHMKNTVSIDGVRIVCKFLDKNNKYIRVSTEQMPVNGDEVLNKIRNVMIHYQQFTTFSKSCKLLMKKEFRKR